MSQASDLERLMLDLINDERAALGLDPLVLDLRLNASSETHSTWMLEEDIFSHTGDGGSSAGNRMAEAGFVFSGNWAWGENIAWQSERGAAGFEDDVAQLHAALMNSSGHRANILNPNFEVIGIGIEFGDFDGWTAVMATQNFARTGAAIDPDPPGLPNMAPAASLPFVFLSMTQPKNIGSLVTYTDAESNAAKLYQIRGDGTGVSLSFGNGVVRPENAPVLTAAQFEALTAKGTLRGVDATLEIRAYDGFGWGNWDAFDLRTPAPQVNLGSLISDLASLMGAAGASDTPEDAISLLADEFDFTAGDPLTFT